MYVYNEIFDLYTEKNVKHSIQNVKSKSLKYLHFCKTIFTVLTGKRNMSERIFVK